MQNVNIQNSICKFNMGSIKMPTGFSWWCEIIILKFTWKSKYVKIARKNEEEIIYGDYFSQIFLSVLGR